MANIILYTGPMFTEKTTSLVKKYEKAHHKSRILVFGNGFNTRDGIGVIKGRDTKEIPAIFINHIQEIENHLKKDTATVMIDELNFFAAKPSQKKELKSSMNYLLDLNINRGINIVGSGLNTTAERDPYGVMGAMMMHADEIHKLFTECGGCNTMTDKYTYYIPRIKKTNELGCELYCAMCGPCYEKYAEKFDGAIKHGTMEQYFKDATILKEKESEKQKIIAYYEKHKRRLNNLKAI